MDKEDIIKILNKLITLLETDNKENKTKVIDTLHTLITMIK